MPCRFEGFNDVNYSVWAAISTMSRHQYYCSPGWLLLILVGNQRILRLRCRREETNLFDLQTEFFPDVYSRGWKIGASMLIVT